MADDLWGEPAKAERPVSGMPIVSTLNESERRMAEIAYSKANATRQAVEPYNVQRASGQKPRVRANGDGSFTISGVDGNTFFGPAQPLPPMAQDPNRGAVGRRLDYQVGYNLLYQPRTTEALGFQQLRNIADNLDVLRLGLETRKDQLEALDWTVKPRDKKGKKGDDGSAQKVIDFLQTPDREHSFSEWMRAVMEDMLVIDAACIYPRLTNGGELYSLDLMDGSLIVPRLDATGRRPVPPSPAYQQILKGVPAVDYTADELVYRPRNVRTHKVYGFSPVEQIVVTVNIALRRQLFQLSYYTEGSVPDAFGFVPENWTPAMIAEYQLHWDALFENPNGGNEGQRRKMKWVPGAKDVKFAKDAILKDEFDEWLARIVCYCLSLEPMPFVKMMNRAVAETQREQSRMEGLLPVKKWWKSFMDLLIAKYFKRPDLEFAWNDEESLDAKARSEIDDRDLKNCSKTVNEVRLARGDEPFPPEIGDRPLAYLASGIIPLEDSLAPPEPPPTVPPAGDAPGAPAAPAADPAAAKPAADPAPAEPAKKLAKANRRAVQHDRRAQQIQTQRLARAIKRQFKGQAQRIAAQLGPSVEKALAAFALAKAPPAEGDRAKYEAKAAEAVAELEWGMIYDPRSWVGDVADSLTKASADAAEQGYGSIGVAIDKEFVSTFSVDYARERGAEMVGMKWVDGELVTNPNAEWAITDETRAAVQRITTEAMENGWSNDRLASQLADDYAFSPERAEMIARTETALADSQGHLASWKDTGVVEQVEWLTANDDLVSDECAANGEQGPIAIGEVFQSGDDAPPTHPNCRCALAPVISQED